MTEGEEAEGELLSVAADMPTAREQLRLASAELAARILEADRPDADCARDAWRDDVAHVLHAAGQIYTWVTAPGPPVSLTLTAGPITDQATGTVAPTSERNTPMALELGDSQQVTITAAPKDAAGQPTADSVEWAVDNTTAVQALQVSADTLSVTLLGAVPATGVTLSATDASGNSAPFVFDVVSGPATSLGLTAGPVTDQAPPAAPSA
jgi:hypothetical protein